MKMPVILSAMVVLSLVLGAGESSAIGLGDIKKKAEKKAKEAADKAKKGETPEAPAAPAAPGSDAEAVEGEDAGSSDKGTVSSVSTKFDFVPGNRVILMDDFTRDELGEFPSRWKQWVGNFDIAEFKNERWLRLNGEDGTVSIKVEALPEKWTLEFDYYHETMSGPAFTIGGMWPNSESFIWHAPIGNAGMVGFGGPNGLHSNAKFPGNLAGRHHVSVMAAGTSLKVYVDRERLVNVPEMTLLPDQKVAAVGLRFWKYGADPMITNVRFAEGGKEKVDMMATPFVTQGIVFDSGSDRLKPESAPVLRQVATYLKENAEVKVMITGHTDDVGETAANQTLSEKRAAAVAASLAGDFGIDAGRMSTAGKGESVPMAKNDSPEGKSMNRRVEFAKG